jgi:hypothetical protein
MQEVSGNIWDFKSKQTPICITTNGFVKINGECVMGRGIAYQAARKYPKLPLELGKRIKSFGNNVFYFPDYDIITFPTKHHWADTADLKLIERSASNLLSMLIDDEYGVFAEVTKIYLVRPGCSNGKLDWKDVKPVIEKILLNDNFIVVQN